MKHNPIALGFAALSAMTVMTACNVDEGRVDKNVEKTILQDACLTGHALNTVEVNAQRKVVLAGATEPKVLTTLKVGAEAEVIAEAAEAMTTAEAKLESTSEDIRLDYHCEDKMNLNVDLTFPESLKSEVIQDVKAAELLSVDTQKVELKKDGVTYVVELLGVDEKIRTSDLSGEDGLNEIKVTISKADGEQMVVSSKSADTVLD